MEGSINQMSKYLLILLLFISCQKQILTIPTDTKLLGVWQEVGYSNKIEIKENIDNK